MKRIIFITLLCVLAFQQTIQCHPIDRVVCPPNKVWDYILSQCRCSVRSSCYWGTIWDSNSCTCVNKVIDKPLPDKSCPP